MAGAADFSQAEKRKKAIAVRNIKILNKKIGEGCPVFIIAEAGINHNGDLRLAKKLVDVAKSSGADVIKFQTYKTEELVTENAPRANYQKKKFSREIAI